MIHHSKNFSKKLLILSMLVLLSASACKNKGGSDGDIAPGGAPSPGAESGTTPSTSSCDPASPSVVDFFTGSSLTIPKSFNRYEKYIGHYEGVIKAYAHSGKFTAYNKYGSTVHIVKDQANLGAPVLPPLASIDVKAPIQDLAFVKVGDVLKLLVGTRLNLQVYNVSETGVTLASNTNVLDGILDIESAEGKTFVINNKGDAFFTPNDNCLNVSFSRIYEAAANPDNIAKHNYFAHKVKSIGDKAFILTRNRDEFDVNFALMLKMFMKSQFMLWNNKVKFVNLADKSSGDVKINTPTTPHVSVSDIAVSGNKLYMGVNEFPLRPPPQNFTQNFNTAVQNYTTCLSAPPPGGCSWGGGSMLSWMMMYLTSNAGVMVQDPASDVSANTPIFTPIATNFNLLGILPMNTGFFYSPRIAINGDILYMNGVYGMEALPNLSTGNTVWDARLVLNAPTANVDLTFAASIDFWENSVHRVGLAMIDDYNFSTDTALGSESSGYIQDVMLPTEQGRGPDAQHSDVYQFKKRFQVLDQTNTTTFICPTAGSWVGGTLVKGATPGDDRYLILKDSGANYLIDKYKPDAAACTDNNTLAIAATNHSPLYSIMQMMTSLRAADTNHSFMLLFDSATTTYVIKAINNNFTSASVPTDVFSNDAAGPGITLSGFPLGFQKIVTTNDSYILYISVVNLAIPGSIFNVDRVVIKKDSVVPSLVAPYPPPLITDKKTITASATFLFAMDADENNVYILGADGVLTTKNATTGSTVGSPMNIYNFTGGEFIMSIPPSIVVRNNKAYMNGIYLGFSPLNLGFGYAITDLNTREVHTFPEVQYLSIHGGERLLGAGFFNENGTELFDF